MIGATLIQEAGQRFLVQHLVRWLRLGRLITRKAYAPEAAACPSWGGGLKQLGEDVAEQLEYVPASVRAIRHVRPKMACSCCE